MTKAEINYKNGKIYKIEPIVDHDEGDIYIGSTTKQYLCQRMIAHKRHYETYKKGILKNKVSAIQLFDKYGFNNCNIILLELVEANSKDELLIREAYFIKTLKCVNKYIPIRTKEEKPIIRKQYYEDNKDEALKKDKIYRDSHKEQKKEWYKENNDLILLKKKQYYEENKERIQQRRKELRQLKKQQKTDQSII
jgi:hypothetical protein